MCSGGKWAEGGEGCEEAGPNQATWVLCCSYRYFNITIIHPADKTIGERYIKSNFLPLDGYSTSRANDIKRIYFIKLGGRVVKNMSIPFAKFTFAPSGQSMRHTLSFYL